MIPAELWAEIRRLRLVVGLSISDIAERLKVNRRTVRRALERETFAPRKDKPRKSLLDPFKPYLKERVEEFPKLSGKRLLEEVRGQGYEGGITILKDYVQTIRPPKVKAFLPLKFAPGQSAQVDWASCGTVSVGRHTRRLSCFVMVLSYSRMLYLEFTVSECMEEFLRCHENAFRFFRGHTPEIVYDNLKSVVLQRAEKEVRFNPRFMAFAGFHTFKPVLCRKRAPHEKGRVENGVGYIKKSFLMGRVFDHFDKVNPAAFQWRDAVANTRIHGTTRKRPVDLFEKERQLLVPLPETSYDTAVVKPVKATVTFRVKFESNTYSVPPRYAGKELILKATAEEVRLFDKADLVAAHPRSFDKYGDIENPEHTEALIQSRRRARREQLVADFLAIGPPAEAYLDGLVHGQLNLYHHLARLLLLDNSFGRHELLGALCTALHHQAFGAHYIENILHQERQRRELPRPKPILLADDPQILEARVPERDLNLYDSLFQDKNHESKDPGIPNPDEQDQKPADDPNQARHP